MKSTIVFMFSKTEVVEKDISIIPRVGEEIFEKGRYFYVHSIIHEVQHGQHGINIRLY